MAEPVKSAASARPDVEAIMAKIRADVRCSVAEDRESRPKYIPPPASERRTGKSLFEFEELGYLNAHWNDWSSSEQLTSHRRIIGPLIVRAKQFILNVVWEHILKGYLDREKQYQAHLVRYLNASAHYIDQRDHEIFWQLVKKMDSDVQGLNERTDRLFDEAYSAIQELQGELGKRASNGR